MPTRTLSEEPVTDVFRPHSLWMTRERTRVADAVVTRRAPPEVAHRDAYLELDVLTTGDVFVSQWLTRVCESMADTCS